MMNRIYKTNIIKRSLLVGMAAVTLLTSAVTPAKTVLADTYDTNIDYEDPNFLDPATISMIKTVAGVIQFVYELSGKIDPMIKTLMGIEEGDSDVTAEKLQEISDKIDNLELKMDEHAEKQLAAMYKSSRLTQFDHDITTVRNMTANYYDNIAMYASNPNTSDVEKAILIGAMLDANTSSTADYLSVVETLASFVNGDQINDNPESILVASYNANCASSMLGCEAAMRNAAYVNNVVTILDYAYKLEALVLDSKIILADNISKMTDEEKKELKKKYEGMPAETKLIAECGVEDKVNVWKKNVGIRDAKGNATGIKRKYELILDSNNPNSAVSKYNRMIQKNWYSYIKARDYSNLRAKITMVPIQIAVGKDIDAKGTGIVACKDFGNFEGDYDEYNHRRMMWYVEKKINSNIKDSGLTSEEIHKILEHIANDPIFETGEEIRYMPIISRLDNLGFSIKEACQYKSSDEENSVSEITDYILLNPIFITGVEVSQAGDCTNHRLTFNYTNLTGKTESYNPVEVGLNRHSVFIPKDMWVIDKSDYTYHRYLWFEKADSEAYSNDEEDNAYNMSEIEAIDSEIREALRIDEVEEEEEDDIYAATDLTVVWNTRDGQMIPKEAVSVEIGYGVTLTATSSNNWKSEVVDLILYDETGDYAYNFVDDSLYGLIAELSDDFIVTKDVITEKDENGFDERHFIVYCDAIAEEDVPEYDDPVIYEDVPEYDDPVIYEDIPEYDEPIILYEDVPEYDAPETYGDGIYW